MFFVLRSTTRSSSRSRRPIWRTSRSATSRGPRIVQRAGRPVGEQPPAELERGRPAGPPWPRRSRAAPRARARSPGRARSGRRGGRARPSRGPPPTGRACREPQSRPISSAAVRPPAPRSASRSRGRSVDRQLADRPAAAGRPTVVAPIGSRHRGTSVATTRRVGRPRARTTEARRFLPPSGPEDDAEPTEGPSPAAHRRASPRRSPADGHGVRRGWRPRRGPAGCALNAACSPIGAQIEPRRTNSQPRARATGTRVANPTTASPTPPAAVAPADGQHVGEREDERRPDQPAAPPSPRPRRSSRSPGTASPRRTGATTAPARSQDEPDRLAGRRQRALRRDRKDLEQDPTPPPWPR